ncbi:phosphatase PAP2 family protein [Rhodopseudomonas palustris]|uniref:phosphatase PAP2 family protein n=1 Tax=Rhodopseudomonas palustris TaxID=1076 RepID=UPI0021F38453|nr:phosphatase PAP2 family protein [Rhodopseudomonas palustris]UYO51917.1 phosphatase PAP2 family protein [Rhodopseudomonas palustris]
MRKFRDTILLTLPLITTITAPPPALAQQQPSCTGICALQAADQEALLAPFNSLPSTAQGRAVLDANLAKQVEIYLNSTQAEKIAAGTVLILPAVPANVLLRAFPGNPAYGYNAQGIPTAPTLPPSILKMEAAIIGSNQIVAMKPYFGTTDVYGNAYGYLPGQTDSYGNPPPYQVSAAILNNPFTPQNSSYLAWQNQQTPGAYKINWVLGDSNVGDFPSAHTMLATSNAVPFAILAPGYYQQFVMAAAQFSYDLNVYAAHYPLDVIGGRIMATYVTANMLAGNPLYASADFNTTLLPSLRNDMQTYLGGGGSSPYAAACANLVACLSSGVIPTATSYQQQAQAYRHFLTYDLPSVGPTDLAPVVPAEAHYLIATRYPYLTTAQLDEILASTELPSGGRSTTAPAGRGLICMRRAVATARSAATSP